MKKKALNLAVILTLTLAILFSTTSIPALANSAQYETSLVSASGVVIQNADSPIVVEKELLTFDIQEFPTQFRNNSNDQAFNEYDAKVTAEYTYYNPSEYTVTSKLLFPFGELPSYAKYYRDNVGNDIAFDDTNKYDITINGEKVERQVRHTLKREAGLFEFDKELAQIKDDFTIDTFYTPDMPVTKYVFTASGADLNSYPGAVAGFSLNNDVQAYRIYCENGSSRVKDAQRVWASFRLDRSTHLFTFILIGDAPSQPPLLGTYSDSDFSLIIDGVAEYVSIETTTLKEYALSNRSLDSAVSEVDWYNALITELNQSSARYGADTFNPTVTAHYHKNKFENRLTRWYEYQITLSPNQRIVNAVTAPVYPQIYSRVEPDFYDYSYLLSPAKTFKEFGELKIVINTPYYLHRAFETWKPDYDFVKTQTGYELTLNTLPDGELDFALSTSENITWLNYSNQNTLLNKWGILINFGVILGVAGVAFLVVLIWKTIKKKRGDLSEKKKA